ncbi:MAG: hypothetical protein ACI4QF_03335 [Kiritimatiellia bacterium]
MRKTSSILLAMLGLRAFALSVPELPRTDYADTEVSTNVTLTALFLCAWNCWVSERISELCAAWKRSSFVTRVVSVAFVGILMAYASTKPPENGQEGRYLCLVSSLPEGQSEVSEPDPHRGETILTREWNLPGAWQYSMRRQDFAGGFVFPYGTNHLACVHVSSQGSVRETRFSTNVIASVGVPLAVVPGLTECSHEYTVSNTYRFVWANAAADRDTNTLVSASIELFRNGDVVVTTNGITRTIPRELPFEHDGYGQDESWVRANFAMLQDIDASLTNVEQVLSIGYTNWVDWLVGVGQLNGLYKFTAEFTEDPPETTQFWIGDFSLAVTNAGKYVVVLEKGEEYEFGTWPFNDDVDYWAQDDMSADAPMLTAWWGGWESPGEWTIDRGEHWLDYPGMPEWGYRPGWCCWLPTLQGSPNVGHLGVASFPQSFEAILSDYCGSCTPSYQWSSSDPSMTFSTPNAPTTTVTCASIPSWNTCTMSVQANLGWLSLWSYLYPTYGTNATPQVHLKLDAPEGLALNGERRLLTANFKSDINTNGCVVVRCINGADKISFWSALTNGVSVASSNSWNVASTNAFSCYVQGTALSDYQGVEFECTYVPESGSNQVVRAKSTVFECYTQPVSNTPRTGLEVINPSFLNLQSNAVFRVEVHPVGIPSSKINWRVAVGSAAFQSGKNGTETVVLGSSGMVDLEVKVLGATDERMHFKANVQQ